MLISAGPYNDFYEIQKFQGLTPFLTLYSAD